MASADDLRERVLAGMSWSTGGRVVHQAVRFVGGVVLARLLAPEAFGLVAMVVVFTGFARRYAELGMGAALVQKQDVEERHRSTVFWLNVGVGLLLAGLFAAGAPAVAWFYGESSLVPLTAALAGTFVLSSLGTLHDTLLRKSINFRGPALADAVAEVVGTGTGIALAASGGGVWSLVVRILASRAIRSAVLWRQSDWRPTLRFDLEAVRELASFSLHLLGTRTLNYGARHLDDLLVGRVIGAGALGLYTKAYALMLFPLQNISRVLGQVMFPSFSEIQGDPDRVRRMYLRIVRVIALLTFPLMLGLWATAESFVAAVFGASWLGMVPLLKVFCFTGLIDSISTLNGTLFLSQGRSDLQFRLSLVTKPTLMVGIVAGLPWGTVGVATGHFVAAALIALPNIYFAGGLVGLTPWRLLQALAGTAACAAVMAAGVVALGTALPAGLGPWADLAVRVPAGAALYLALVHTFGLPGYREVRGLLGTGG